MYAMNFAQVGANIQRALDEQSMTQQKLADALSAPNQVMSKIINGVKAVNSSELARIADVLGTTAKELLAVSASDLPAESAAFMRTIQDEETREKAELIASAIDEIQMLEGIIGA